MTKSRLAFQPTYLRHRHAPPPTSLAAARGGPPQIRGTHQVEAQSAPGEATQAPEAPGAAPGPQVRQGDRPPLRPRGRQWAAHVGAHAPADLAGRQTPPHTRGLSNALNPKLEFVHEIGSCKQLVWTPLLPLSNCLLLGWVHLPLHTPPCLLSGPLGVRYWADTNVSMSTLTSPPARGVTIRAQTLLEMSL